MSKEHTDSWFVEEVRKNCKTMDTALAVDKAISDMPEDFEIKRFLMEHRIVSSHV